MSAAQRDVYYRLVLKARPPVPDAGTLREAEAEIQQMLREARIRANARSRYHRRKEHA